MGSFGFMTGSREELSQAAPSLGKLLEHIPVRRIRRFTDIQIAVKENASAGRPSTAAQVTYHWSAGKGE